MSQQQAILARSRIDRPVQNETVPQVGRSSLKSRQADSACFTQLGLILRGSAACSPGSLGAHTQRGRPAASGAAAAARCRQRLAGSSFSFGACDAILLLPNHGALRLRHSLARSELSRARLSVADCRPGRPQRAPRTRGASFQALRNQQTQHHARARHASGPARGVGTGSHQRRCAALLLARACVNRRSRAQAGERAVSGPRPGAAAGRNPPSSVALLSHRPPLASAGQAVPPGMYELALDGRNKCDIRGARTCLREPWRRRRRARLLPCVASCDSGACPAVCAAILCPGGRQGWRPHLRRTHARGACHGA